MSVITSDKEKETTTIKQETMTFELEEGMSMPLVGRHPSLPTTGQPTDIKAFLGRPFNFSSYSWSTASTPGTDIFNISILSTINSISMYTTKLKGFRNWKFTVCIKLVLAPSPFHAGALRLSWLPWMASNNNNRGNMHKGLIPNSQLPGIMITCEDNSAEMKIPYIGPVYGYDKAAPGDSWSWGNLRLAVYSALATGTGSSTVAIDGYIWLEDIELSGMTAQSKYQAKKKKKSQMLITDSEIEEGKGPISRVLGSGAVLANRIGDFPVLSSFFKPAAWVLNALKGSAEAFGYSKPTTGERQDLCLMVRNQDAFAPNTNGIDNAINLSALGDAKTTMHSMMQVSNFEESSIDYIKRQWSYYETFNISTSNVSNDILYSKLIAPRSLNKTYTMPASASSNYTVFWMTPVAYFGEVFESYRGDIEVRFVFVKTGYHACQVEIAFSLDQTTTSSTEYYLREVVDIQKGNEVCFTLPYNRVEPFIPTYDNFGTLQVSLVNSLQAPTSVSNTISVMVFYRGGENLEFARPNNFAPIPVMGPQGAYTEKGNDAICTSPDNIGNSVSHTPSVVSQFAVGEQIKSLKQLCNKYSRLYWNFSPNTGSPCLIFDPQWHGSYTTTFTTYYLVTPARLSGDYYSRFSALFLAHTGSVKIRVKNAYGTTQQGIRSTLFSFNPNGSNVDIVTYTGPDKRNFVYPDYTIDNTLASSAFRVPQFSRQFAYPHVNYDSSIGPAWYNQTLVLLEPADGSTSLSGNQFNLYRSVGEDFQFQFFLGIPTVLTNYSAS